jgi:hypothetical protein
LNWSRILADAVGPFSMPIGIALRTAVMAFVAAWQ